jgi:hypothetical protein
MVFAVTRVLSMLCPAPCRVSPEKTLTIRRSCLAARRAPQVELGFETESAVYSTGPLKFTIVCKERFRVNERLKQFLKQPAFQSDHS